MAKLISSARGQKTVTFGGCWQGYGSRSWDVLGLDLGGGDMVYAYEKLTALGTEEACTLLQVYLNV